MLNLLYKLRREKKAQDLVEYALLLAGIAVGTAVVVNALGGRIRTLFGDITFTG